MFTTKQAYGIDHDRASDAEQILVDALREYAQKSADLLSKAAQVRDTVDRVERYLAEDYNVNSLGELQGRASDFDRLCSERQAAAAHVTKLAWQLKTLGVLTEDRMDAILSSTPFARVKAGA